MPRHGVKSGGLMSFQLTNPKNYCPGDEILGTVTINSKHQGKPVESLRIKLLGRSKTKIVKKNNNGTRIYRGRQILVSETVNFTRQNTEVSDSEDGTSIWGIHIGLPSKPMESGKTGRTTHQLPSIFYYKQRSFWSGTRQEAYVEYWLEANSTAGTASYPLFVRFPSTEYPTQDFDAWTNGTRINVTSYKLLPEFADSELTFGQKTKESFNSSKVPRYGFRVHFNVPRIFQMDHPEPLPLHIWLTPWLDDKYTTVFKGDASTLPPVKILSAKAKLKSCCDTTAEGVFEHSTSKESDHPIGSTTFEGGITIPALVDPRETSDPHGARQGAQWTAADMRPRRDPPPPEAFPLGQILDAHISHKHSTLRGRTSLSPENNVYASFKTQNISMSYTLIIQLQLGVGGKQVELKHHAPLKLLPTAEEQAREREERLGQEGMQKNYDDLEAAADNGEEVLDSVMDLIGNMAG